jgi:hypothetical protein
MAEDVEVIWVEWEREYFCEEVWTGGIRLQPKENFRQARARDEAAFGFGPRASTPKISSGCKLSPLE